MSAVNFDAIVRYLGHSNVAIKSKKIGEKGLQEEHFTAVGIDKAEDFIDLRNGKRQLWINLQRLRSDLTGKYISFKDVESYKNIYIDLDCEKPDGFKDYAATNEERVKALSLLPTLKDWLESNGLKSGLELHTGNGCGMLLPIPEIKAEPVFIAKLATFLKLIRTEIPSADAAMFDPPRVIGIPGTLNVKLETTDRKNCMREVVGAIPKRVEDPALLDFINALVPDQDTLKSYREKYDAPQEAPQEEPRETPHMPEDVAERLQELFTAVPSFKSKLFTPAPKGQRSNHECYLCACLWEVGFSEPEIHSIMDASPQTKWHERKETYRKSTITAGITKAEASRKEKEPELVRAEIQLSADLQENEAKVLKAINDYNEPPRLFQRAGRMCWLKNVSEDLDTIEELSDKSFRTVMSRAATFERWDKRANDWINCEPPLPLAGAIVSLDKWDLPYINGIVNMPVVRPDGTLLLDPGYDKVTGLYYKRNDLVIPDIPERPTQADAIKAATFFITEVLKDFPFVDDASKVSAVAGFLTPIVRAMVGCVPMCLFSKPVKGTGASKLTELISIVTTGRAMEPITAPTDEDEWRKKITSFVKEGGLIVPLDNVASDMYSAALSSALTDVYWRDRLLSTNDAPVYRMLLCFYATGNNLRLKGDLPRRSYLSQLDAEMERPWERKTELFWHPKLNKWVFEHRGELLAALLTMVRAWVVAGRPPSGNHVMGNFEEWTEVLGGILGYAKVEGFLDNAEILNTEVDTGGEEWAEFLHKWWVLLGELGYSSTELLGNLENSYQPLGKVVPSEISERLHGNSPGNARKLSDILNTKVHVRYANGLMLEKSRDKHTKNAVWCVKKIQDEKIFE